MDGDRAEKGLNDDFKVVWIIAAAASIGPARCAARQRSACKDCFQIRIAASHPGDESVTAIDSPCCGGAEINSFGRLPVIRAL